ncbi:MAG: hypothetical protein AB7N24_01010 [Dehalococcoidia bacterium]
MIRNLFERKASYEAEVLAEAQALVDDGLELDFVLDLFPEDAEWLRSSLVFIEDIETAYDSEPASYYFEASLKSKFLGAAVDPRPVVPVVIPAPTFSPLRTAISTMSVAAATAIVGVVSFGFITAGDSVPGDWNYTFKLAGERFEYTTSRGNDRIDVQLRQVENRVTELNKLSSRGDVSPEQLERVQREIKDLGEITKNQQLDSLRKAQIESGLKGAAAVVNDVVAKQPDLTVPAAAVAAAIDDTVTTLAAPPATATASPTATSTATASPSASATPEPTASASPEPTATPESTETPTPEATGTVTAEASATATEEATATEAPIEGETTTPETSPTP